MTKPAREHELRCMQCTREPLLATYGVNKFGEIFVHIKAWKQKRLITESVVTGGSVMLRCRECFRWNRVTIQGKRAQLSEDIKPAVLG